MNLMRKTKKTLSLLLLATALTACQQGAKAPEAIGPLPSEYQLTWHEMETYAFIHFGLNTFADKEWGYGDTPAEVFNPSNLDCEQWVQTIKAAGMTGVILTAKHHDGFCLWQTDLTEYSIRNSPRPSSSAMADPAAAGWATSEALPAPPTGPSSARKRSIPATTARRRSPWDTPTARPGFLPNATYRYVRDGSTTSPRTTA